MRSSSDSIRVVGARMRLIVCLPMGKCNAEQRAAMTSKTAADMRRTMDGFLLLIDAAGIRATANRFVKELNSLVELFKLTLACKWRERERKALSGHIYTLPECNPLSPSRGRPSRALANLARGTSARGAGAIYICGNNLELSHNEFYQFVSEGRDRAMC